MQSSTILILAVMHAREEVKRGIIMVLSSLVVDAATTSSHRE